MKKLSYRATVYASYAAYVVQAAVNNIPPILFLILSRNYGLSLSEIAFLMSFNFLVQICVDVFGARYADRIGYRTCVIWAHVTAFLGLAGFGILPRILPSCFVGCLIPLFFYACGGGLIEVIISPIMESLPSESKAGAMSMLHSFYCWGQMFVVLASTGILVLFGTEYWYFVPILWSILPLVNAFVYARVPICTLAEEHERAPLGKLLRMRVYRLLLLLMFCGGACELAMSQWASIFAELGLHVTKTVGDLLGPMLFAFFQALGRVYYGRNAERLPLRKSLFISGIFCVFCYLVCVFAPWPLLSLCGCALCGLSVALFWPGTLSLAAQRVPTGNISSFALLALAGDCGCTAVPALVGLISDSYEGTFLAYSGDAAGLHLGLLAAAFFPLLLVLCTHLLKEKK